MRIMPVTQTSYKPRFKSNANWVCDKYGNKIYKTTTYFFRDDLEWVSLIKFLCTKYKDVPKVNFVNHACSNGMEPLSFLISFLIYAPEQAEKFTPIIAKDINKDNIIAAQNGFCGASSDDFIRTFRFTKGKLRNFLNINRANNAEDVFYLSPQENLKNKIIYEQGDLFKDIPNLTEDNTILSCRNVWMYFSPEECEHIAHLMGKHLGKNSTIILGFLDSFKAHADKLLEKNGFKRCPTGITNTNILFSKD